MQPDPEHIDDDSAKLLLYLAGELPVAERAQFQRRLESDAALRQNLQKLQVIHETVGGALTAADASEPSAGGGALQRRAGMAIKYWVTARQEQAARPIKKPVAGLPWWILPCSAAAAIILLGLFFWRTSVDVKSPAIEADIQPLQNTEEVQPKALAALSSDDLVATSDLNAVENELNAVAYLRTLTQ